MIEPTSMHFSQLAWYKKPIFPFYAASVCAYDKAKEYYNNTSKVGIAIDCLAMMASYMSLMSFAAPGKTVFKNQLGMEGGTLQGALFFAAFIFVVAALMRRMYNNENSGAATSAGFSPSLNNKSQDDKSNGTSAHVCINS